MATNRIVKQDQIIHLHQESACIWTISILDFYNNIDNGLVKSLKSPLYCMKKFSNFQWFFLFKKVEIETEAKYDLMFYSKETGYSPLDLDFSFYITDDADSFPPLIKRRESLFGYSRIKNRKLCDLQFKPKHTNCTITLICKIVQKEITNVEFLRSYESFFLNGKLSDFEIIVQKNKRYKTHKVLLAANSPVFQRMFCHEMRENILNEVEIDDIDPEVIQEFLRYIYTGNVINLDKYAHRLFKVACKYEMENLKATCSQVLFENLRGKNVIDILVLSDLYADENLKSKCLSLISEKFEHIRKQKVYKNLEKSHSHILMDIFNAVSSRSQKPKSEESKESPALSEFCTISSRAACAWTMNSTLVSKSPNFELEVSNLPEARHIYWWFELIKIHNDSSLLYLHVIKDVGSTTKCSVKFKIIFRNPEPAIVTTEISLDDIQIPSFQLIKLPQNLTNLTILWTTELISKPDFKSISHLKCYDPFFQNESLSDVMLKNNGKIYPAHKIILASGSEWFKKSFLQENICFSKNSNYKSLVDLNKEDSQMQDINSKIFEELLRYLYTGMVQNFDLNIYELYDAANKYEVQGLKIICENTLQRNLSVENVISTLVFSETNNMECLREYCILFTVWSYEAVKQDCNFESLGKFHPKILMEIIEALHTSKLPSLPTTTSRVEIHENVVLDVCTKTIRNVLSYIGETVLRLTKP